MCPDSVRLLNGSSVCSGRLEVKSDQTWSSVCEADFDQQDAEVVCRELDCGPPSVLQGALYGEGEAPMWTKEFQCGGHESALLDCRSSDSDRNTCSPGRAARLTCSDPDDVRLVGGASRCAGILEVNLGEWRPVGVVNWTLKTAAVFCEHLDCGSAVSVGKREETFYRFVWWIEPDCVQSGSPLRECALSYFSTSSILDLTCSGPADPTVLLIKVVVLPLTLLLLITVLCFYCRASRGQRWSRQENVELVELNLGVAAAEGGPTGAQEAEENL
ncbi:scavenger receptor cysteine-rich type 1 protein M130-like isoform X1 [Melanotaenia boesemani]|uniref:scavenger receptor cysteine-rich type 1 protein M130-like isoform X1 n=1 Tax=Melanotaenia boesemani TaxID=1250792 RepID=UPI001C03AB3C|nr:scavenger receptor cysteine-rich type 1 protein M130-like isoform X1 [Melanotaenia boesemani]